MGSDPLRLEDFSDAQYADENLCNLAAPLLIWCLLTPNCANEEFAESNISPVKLLPIDGTQNCDTLSNSTAIQITLLLESGKNKIFHASERAVEYVQKKRSLSLAFSLKRESSKHIPPLFSAPLLYHQVLTSKELSKSRRLMMR